MNLHEKFRCSSLWITVRYSMNDCQMVWSNLKQSLSLQTLIQVDVKIIILYYIHSYGACFLAIYNVASCGYYQNRIKPHTGNIRSDPCLPTQIRYGDVQLHEQMYVFTIFLTFSFVNMVQLVPRSVYREICSRYTKPLRDLFQFLIIPSENSEIW